ncbi:polysaccharide biosynthesis C-terminal domain-containing protein [Natronincola peptidivorans]|nr:WxcM-like domain-containing protein [Natronincola peptidivorans]
MDKFWEFISIDPYEDQRGMLKKIVMKSQLQNSDELGEVYLLYSNPNSVRGNHYHKKSFEYFTVIGGRAKIALKGFHQDISEEFYITADDNIILKVPPFTIHAFKNEGPNQLIILAISSKEYSPADTDTYISEIL